VLQPRGGDEWLLLGEDEMMISRRCFGLEVQAGWQLLLHGCFAELHFLLSLNDIVRESTVMMGSSRTFGIFWIHICGT